MTAPFKVHKHSVTSKWHNNDKPSTAKEKEKQMPF